MRSLRQQVLIPLLASLVVLAASLILIFGSHMRERAISAAIIKAQSDLATCAEIISLKYPGDWQVINGNLYKGDYLISFQQNIVDSLSTLTGDSVTIFLNDTRVATTILDSEGKRAIGTKVSNAVANKVLKNGERYLGEANVVGQLYQTAYEPIRDVQGNILGMLYVGISRQYTQEHIVNSLWQTATLGVGITLLVSLLAWIFIEKVIIRPLRNITLGTRDLATGHTTDKVEVSGPKEIGELASAFNQMIERLENVTIGMENKIPLNNSTQVPSESFQSISVVPASTEEPSATAIQSSSDHQSDAVSLVQQNDVLLPVPEKQGQPGLPEHTASSYRVYVEENELPKGLNKETLLQIMDFLEIRQDSFTTEEIAEGVKLTRVTVRRYLEYLEQAGELTSQLKYGTVGRPVRIWCHKENLASTK